MDRIKDITGQRFGRLVALRLDVTKPTNRGTWWEFGCDCGQIKSIRGHDVVDGKVKSCGCLKKEGTHRTHNGTHTPEYDIWCDMKKRCTNPNAAHYKDYGGRGIKVCERWQDFAAFREDMGPRPGPEWTIERRNVDGDYCPENCEWIPAKDQAHNKRNSDLITFNGRTQTLSKWAIELGLDQSTLFRRIHRLGWPIEEALTTPRLSSRWARSTPKSSPQK